MTGPMTAKEIFLAAFVMSDPAERDAYLGKTCGSDDALRREVIALLKAHFEADSLLDQPRIEARIAVADELGVPATVLPFTERPGSQIGPFKLLEQIGEGGMGVVYMAEQQRPVRRKVALKIIKPGMDTKQVIARFEAERQALAMMDHPNIAHVLDAGSTDSQRPYFVMELVRGIPITEYCDKNKLDTRARLKLFVSVCQAVQHAHTKGIIHRDLKPSNVLVTLHDGVPVPKIIDFGVAKATNQQLTERTLFTSFAQMVGTPLYMSPEQAEMSGLDVDTRSDIYSLGVLLYELLTGTTPFDRNRIHTAAYDEVRRIIREEEPDKPSTRISTMGEASDTVSARRATDPKKLKQLLRRELDWVVMKALEKDRTRRYETASALVAEVTRYLNGEPVEACPPSTVYRMRKYIQRNRTAVAVASGFVLFLVTSSAVSWVLYANARRARNQAVAAQADFRVQRDRAVGAERASTMNLKLATTEKNRAEAETARADAHGKELKQRLYDYNIIKAAAAHRDQQLDLAKKLLDDCLEDQRAWEWRYLHRLTGGEHTVDLPGEAIIDFALTPDGQRVLAIDEQGTVRLLDLSTRSEIWAARTSIVAPTGSDVSADGELAAVTGVFPVWYTDGRPVSGVLKVFEARTGKIKWEAASADEHIMSPAFSPDGRRMTVIVGSVGKGAGTLQLRDCGDGKVIWSKQTLALGGASFDPQGRFVYLNTGVGSPHSATMRCLAVDDGREVWSVQRPNPSFVVPSRDGTELISGGPRHSLVVWDPATGEKKQEIQGPSSEFAFAIRRSNDGKRVLTVGFSGQIVVWDWTAKRVHKSFGTAAAGPFLARFTPDGQQLAYVSSRTAPLQFRSIDPAPPALELVGHANEVKDVAFRNANEELISTGTDGTMRFWSTRTGQELKTLTVGGAAHALDYVAESGLLATGGADGAKLWDGSSGKLLQHWSDVGPVWWVKLAPRGGRLAAAGERELKVWETGEGRELHSSRIDGVIEGLAFSPEGRHVVTLARPGGEVVLWNLDSKQRVVLRPKTAGEVVRSVEFMPDGKAVVAGTDQSIELWELGTQRKLATLHGHNAVVRSLALDASGSRLFSGDADGRISLWNLDTRERLLTFEAHDGVVWSLAISSDGETLASCGGDGLVKLWETSRVPEDVARQRLIVRQATDLVNQRFVQRSSVRDVLESLTADKSLDQQVLSVALAVANARSASPHALQARRGRQPLGGSDLSAIGKHLDEARKSLVDAIAAAVGADLNAPRGSTPALTPSEWHATANHLVDAAASGVRPDELVALLTPLAEPPSAPHHFSYLLGLAHTRLGQWREAETALTAALNRVQSKTDLWHEYAYRLAFLRAYLGQWDEYHSLCQQTLADFADTNDMKLAERTAKMCLFARESRINAEQAGALADKAIIMGSPPPSLVPYFMMAKGIADLRREDYDGAIVSLGTAAAGLRTNNFPSASICLAATDLYLAIAYQCTGRHDDAREILAAANTLIEQFPSPNSAIWNDWMNVMVVLPEAREIVGQEGEF